MDILRLLQNRGVIDENQSADAAAYMQERGVAAEAALIQKGVEPEQILTELGAEYAIPVYRFERSEKIDPNVLRYVPEESARHYHIIPLKVQDGVLLVGVTDPDNLSVRDALNFISSKIRLPYKLMLILEQDFEKGLEMYENLTGEVDEALSELETELTAELETRMQDKEETKEDEKDIIKEDAPVTKIVATMLRYAADGRASDIHIEPVRGKTRVRFRIDGVLSTSLELPAKIHSSVVARIKILCSMRLDEKRKPQDGRFSATIDNRKIDFRVSTLPTYYGEKVAMRILDPETGVRSFEATGISAHNLAMITEAIKEPHGIILISGPTGSGKSTTLYAMLGEVDCLGKNVLSLEDPVEYNIDGVNQSQVRPEIGFTFASGLRSVLRQDPDVIMVGEIRDKETAQLAIQAALTGHLVLSTIHTNNAIGVIPRLIDMGVDPYLIAPTLIVAMAQRLVRKICPGTGRKVPIEGSLKMMIEHEFEGLPEEYHDRIPSADHVLEAEPSVECSNGTRGRTAVMEVIKITNEVERLILSGAAESDIYKEARKNGFMSMKEDAIIKAMEGVVPFEEVNTLGGALLVSDEAEAEQPIVDNPHALSEANDV